MSRRPTITDHALLRYIERAHGIDLAPLRREIEAIVADAVAAGALSLKRAGLKYHLTPDGTLKTITPVGVQGRFNPKLKAGKPRERMREAAE